MPQGGAVGGVVQQLQRCEHGAVHEVPQEREAGSHLQAAARRDEAAAGVRSVDPALGDERVPHEGGCGGKTGGVLQDAAGQERGRLRDGIYGLP